MTDPLLLTTNFSNATNSLNGSIGSTFGLLPIVGIVVIVAVVAVFVGSSVARIEWVHEKLQTFSQSLYYTFVGLASTVVLGVILTPIYFVSQADSGTQKLALYAVGGLIIAYVVFTGLGVVVDRVLLSTWREYKENIEPTEVAESD
jgi:hypothetical protein